MTNASAKATTVYADITYTKANGESRSYSRAKVDGLLSNDATIRIVSSENADGSPNSYSNLTLSNIKSFAAMKSAGPVEGPAETAALESDPACVISEATNDASATIRSYLKSNGY